MKWPLTWTRTRDAEVAAMRAERDHANADKRKIGAALSEMEAARTEALSQRDALLAILATATVRGERGRMVRWADTEAGRYWKRECPRLADAGKAVGRG